MIIKLIYAILKRIIIKNSDKYILKLMMLVIILYANLSYFYPKNMCYEKHQLISSIFPENIQFSNNKCRTPRINEALRLMLLIDKGSRGNRNGEFSMNLEVSQKYSQWDKSRNQIPHYKKAKNLMFDKKEILASIKEGKVRTLEELEQ
jgi:hypothetical protein